MSSEKRSAWWASPYLWLALSILCIPISEICLKKGAALTAATPSAGPFGFSVLASSWTWIGIAVYIGNFLCWIYALRSLPLSRAYTLMASVHVLVPLGSWIFLGEYLGSMRIAGIVLVMAGIMLIVKPAVEAEEKL